MDCTKDDEARILHIIADPTMAMVWSEIRSERQTRKRKLGNPDSDPWNKLTIHFNDYTLNKYENAVTEEHGLSGGSPDMSCILDRCRDINPTISGRPFRNSRWFYNHYFNVIERVLQCFNEYRYLANQEAANIIEEWMRCAEDTGNKDEIVLYARAVLDDHLLNQLRRHSLRVVGLPEKDDLDRFQEEEEKNRKKKVKMLIAEGKIGSIYSEFQGKAHAHEIARLRALAKNGTPDQQHEALLKLEAVKEA